MSATLPADAAIRERALDPGASFIVQAPAGSGKTELLTRRYLRLLATVAQPEEILAITFTRKAAAEMRFRVMQALELGTNGQPPAETHRVALWHLARAALAADARHGWRLQEHPARLKVQTIDALNHSLARQLPILAGSGAAIRIAKDSEPLYAEAVLRVVEHLGSQSGTARAVERLVRHLDNRLDTFTALLTDLLKRRDHWLDLDLLHGERAALRRQLESAIEAAVVDRLERLAALWPRTTCAELAALAGAAADRLRTGASSHPLTAWEMPEFPDGQLLSLPAWRGLAGLLLLKDKAQWRKTVDRNAGFPPEYKEQKQALVALLEQLGEADSHLEGELARRLDEARQLPAVRYAPDQWAALEALLEVLKIAVAELELVFRERGLADHVAAALAGRLALGKVDAPTDLALKLDYSLKHLLVDEFQDTSRGQIRLLRLLTAGWTRGDGRSLFLVGDPMQSIYRFREADVGLFLKLQREGLGDLEIQPLTLSVNFRSHAPIVEWVNTAFRRVLPQRDDAERGAVQFTPSSTRPNVPTGGTVYVHPLCGNRPDTRAREAELVAELVTDAQERDPRGRIAILVAARTHLTAILPVLAAQGVRYQAVEIDRLQDRPVVRDLLGLTRALVHPADRTAWLSVLRAPWCGLVLADLHALAGEPSQSHVPETIWSRITDPAVIAHLTPDGTRRLERLRDVLHQALDERGRQPLRDWVERAWHALGGPATVLTETGLQDAEAFLDRLDELERAGDLEDVARLEAQIADLFAMPDSTAPDTAPPPIEVMTLHKAKGLEFETVILPALERTASREDSRLLRWLELPRADDRPALLVAPMAARHEDEDPLHVWLRRMEQERALYERGRQLYVGATRAIRELHLIGSVVLPQDAESPRAPAGDSFLGLLWPSMQAHFPAASPIAATGTGARAEQDGLRRVPAAWVPPFASLEEAAAPDAIAVIAGTLQPEFDWVSETGRHVGTLVHREIERLSRRGSGTATVADTNTVARYRLELAELGVPETHRAAAAERVVAALHNLLDDERGRWLLQGPDVHREATSELALSGYVGRALVNGVIDRTFVAADGTRWIVDFKTGVHVGAGLQEFLASEAARYRPQLERYAALMRAWRPDEPVRAALYFPLLRAWREVDVGQGD